MDILLKRITTQGNYSDCVVSGCFVRSNESYHTELKRLIHLYNRYSNPIEKDIVSQIRRLERYFKCATNWLTQTGVGLSVGGTMPEHVSEA